MMRPNRSRQRCRAGARAWAQRRELRLGAHQREPSLDTFGIETDPDDAASEAAFVIGKYLTPSLYVSYGIGLLDPVKTVKLRYEISKRWRLVTESSSAASGGDVFYNIERGR